MSEAESILEPLSRAVPEARAELVPNPSPCAQHSLRVEPASLPAVARWLAGAPEPGFDYLSNLTGVDWPEENCLEVVYHLYSMARRRGPLVLRVRTADREGRVDVPSVVSVWRSAELQEREVYDLYGVRFPGHPDLRRLLMWEEFQGHPMRKDYVEPDDYEYEPTSHSRRGGA